MQKHGTLGKTDKIIIPALPFASWEPFGKGLNGSGYQSVIRKRPSNPKGWLRLLNGLIHKGPGMWEFSTFIISVTFTLSASLLSSARSTSHLSLCLQYPAEFLDHSRCSIHQLKEKNEGIKKYF